MCTGLGILHRTGHGNRGWNKIPGCKDLKLHLVPPRHSCNLHTVHWTLRGRIKLRITTHCFHPFIQQVVIAGPLCARHWGLAVNKEGKILCLTELKFQREGWGQGRLASKQTSADSTPGTVLSTRKPKEVVSLLGRCKSRVPPSLMVTAMLENTHPSLEHTAGALGVSGKALWKRQDTSSFEGQASLKRGREGCAPGEGTA